MAAASVFSQLSSLTTTEIVSVMSVLGGTAFLVVKALWAVTNFFISNKQLLKGFLGGGSANEEVLARLDTIIKQTHGTQLESQLEKIIDRLDQIQDRDKRHEENINDHIVDIVVMRKDIEAAHQKIYQQLQDLLYAINSRRAHSDQVFDNMREILRRNEDITSRVLSHLEKLDEFARATVPEFRSYHKDLTKELSELSRDIALVERSIDTNINNINSIKLR